MTFFPKKNASFDKLAFIWSKPSICSVEMTKFLNVFYAKNYFAGAAGAVGAAGAF